MPDVRNCKRCGRIFNYIGGRPICHDCKKQDEEEFKKVKEYLYEHPKASILEVSNVLEISVQKIKSYLREGRLEIVGNDGNLILECEKCGRSITTGRFCNECSRELSEGFKSSAEEISKSASGDTDKKKPAGMGMKYLNKYEKWNPEK
ncbi:MAG TPA: MerR family transcriptional regulator [Acetivibrio sp.]|uniref:MerR family transcriptional regulator n=1 Tax=Acetivibrio sp. TaxID=1872092 RepID=UPI002C4B6964|nr:MerR family transcriptional regulator [Acetivibrio sp.]HOM01328.1 MerR family transcriptional regulator [Acetivibrio sp.]